MTWTFDSQPAASTDPSMPSLAVANRSCPKKNTFALFLLVMFSLNTFPASRNNSRIFSAREAVPIFYNLLSIFFPLIFPITFLTQYSAAMVFYTRTPTAKLHTTKRHVLCFEFITFNFILCSPCFGMGKDWHWSFPIILDLSKCLLEIQDYCQPCLFHARI